MVLGKKIISFPAKHLINYATFQRYSSHFSIGKRARFHSLFFFFLKSDSKVPNVNSNGVFVTICVNTVVGLTRVIKKRINRIAWMVILNSYYPAHQRPAPFKFKFTAIQWSEPRLLTRLNYNYVFITTENKHEQFTIVWLDARINANSPIASTSLSRRQTSRQTSVIIVIDLKNFLL